MSDSDADVVVVGAGPAGIAAAVTSAERGLSTVLVDEMPRPGGQIWRHRPTTRMRGPARRWLSRLERSGVRMLNGTAVIDVPAPDTLLAVRADDALRLRAARGVILAGGARELFLPFPGWTLPGVVGAGGAQALLKGGLDVRGRTAVVAGSGPLLLPVAAALVQNGARVAAIVEQAEGAAVRSFARSLWRTPGRLLAAMLYRAVSRGARYRTGAWVARADGADRVESVTLSDGRTIACDLLCTGYGLVPSIELALLAGCSVRGGAVSVDAHQRTSVPGIWCAGESCGVAGWQSALVQGRVAALAMSGAAEREMRPVMHERERHARFAHRLDRTFAVRREVRALAGPDTIACRCEDVPLGSLSSYGSMREAKLHTRAGMGPCQGRTCGPALQALFGWEADVPRPPLVPTAVGTFESALHNTHGAD